MKEYFLTSVPNEDSNQPVHQCIFIVYMNTAFLAIQMSPREDSDQIVNAQADQTHCWMHKSEGVFSDVAAQSLLRKDYPGESNYLQSKRLHSFISVISLKMKALPLSIFTLSIQTPQLLTILVLK